MKLDATRCELLFLPLGGVGEIGMNLALYGYGSEENRQWIIVDLGVSFAGPEIPGADLVLPDIRFLENERQNICGMIITHAHEDHYGAILDLWPKLCVPIFCTPFTAGMLETKRLAAEDAPNITPQLFRAGDIFNIGPFTIEPVAVSHSIPEAVSLAISTPLGTIVHTGDWKIDLEPSLGLTTDSKRFKEIGKAGVLALMCDSTNATREGVSATEHQVGKSLREIISAAKGRVAITTFSSNIGRIKSIASAAEHAGRKVMLLGRSIKRCVSVASDLGYLEDVEAFISEEEYGFIPPKKIVIVLTGSQGEQRAALAKLSRGELRNISLSSADTVIYSSRSIPGNEREIIATQNRLIDRGVKIITDNDRLVHVSGHPRRHDLMQMYQWVKPKILVPVHGEPIHLTAQSELAASAGIKFIPRVRNGDVLRLAPGDPEVIDQVPYGQVYKDGKLIGDEEELGIVRRRKLSYVGHVSVSLVISSSHHLAAVPAVIINGLPQKDAHGVLMEKLLFEAVEAAFNNIPRSKRKDIELLREACRRAARSAANNAWGKKPVVDVVVHRVNG